MGSGQLQSPNYPNKYPNDKDCHWIITAPFGFAIVLDFQTFEVRYNFYTYLDRLCWTKENRNQQNICFQTEALGCDYDYVDIRDGGVATSTKLGKFCGNKLPNTIKSTGNQLFVRFRSDSSGQRKGFSASFTKGKK